jgi:Membrane protein involved in colicin uptake
MSRHSNFTKVVSTVLCTLFLPFSISALEVDKTELQSAGGSGTVVFINYTGPHSVIDSAASIRAIGTNMGTVVGKDPAAASSAGDRNKYSVIHAVDPTEKGKLDADIMFIGAGATVDHIDNLRRIISSYLSAAYKYSSQDADTLAVFITVYNAVYRGKLDAYQAKYKSVVMKNLSAGSCGLAITYKEWPGNTQIVIPLYDAANGGLSTIDTSVISDTKVVKSMQQDDGKNIDSRKQMVDIKERESDNATAKAQTTQKTATEEQKKLADAQQQNEVKKQEAAQAQKAADTAAKEAAAAKQTAEANPNDKQAQKAAEEKQQTAEVKQQSADQKKAEAAAQQQVTDEQQQKTDTTKQQAADAQAQADKKQTEAQTERTEIAKDQQQVMDTAAADAKAPAAYGMLLTDEKALLSGLVKINADTGKILKSSPVTYIRGRTVYSSGTSFIAIAGQNSGNGAVKLILLDPSTMEMTKESTEIVAENSVLVQDGADYYCVIQDGKNWVLGKYDAALTLTLKSPVAVKSSTPVTISADKIIVTGNDGSIRLLSKSDLTEVTAAAKTGK